MGEQFSCPACDRQFPWKADYAEKQVKCKCGEVFVAPSEPDGPPEEDEAYDIYDLNEDEGPKASATPAKAESHDVTAAVPVEEEDPYGVDFDDEPAKPAPVAKEEAEETVAAAVPVSKDADSECPECGHGISTSAVMCINCGFNLKEGKKLDTRFSKVIDRSGSRQRLHREPADGFFGRLSRSWEFAKISYGIIWNHKSLTVFPVFSTMASILVFASFILPLWGTGQLDHFMTMLDEESTEQVPIHIYLITFAFYFCGFFVIVFFNTALTACAMKVCDGGKPTVGYGLSIAAKRLPQILSWALVSALVGVILKAIENANEKVGKFVAALIGSAWTILTYFVVPVLCVEGVGPVDAVKQSAKTIKATWGEMIMGNFSLGLLAFLVTLPLYAVCVVIVFIGLSNDSMVMFFLGVGLFILCATLVAIASSAADVVFKALLYNYATGRSVPSELDETALDAAFASSPEK